MSVPAQPGARENVDPFGLWTAAVLPDAAGGLELQTDPAGLAYAVPAGEGTEAVPFATVPVWSLSLTHENPGGEEALAHLAEKVQAIEKGLDQASPRLDAFLARREGGEEAVSFATPNNVPQAESSLALSLNALTPGAAPPDVSFGVGEAMPSGLNLEMIQQRFQALMSTVNHQLLHAAWVETQLDGRLAVRTTITWGGDLQTFLRPDLPAPLVTAHRQSITLAVQSRSANLRTVVVVVRLAGKLMLALTTPIGAVQALGLAWQFVSDVIMPLIDDAQ